MSSGDGFRAGSPKPNQQGLVQSRLPLRLFLQAGPGGAPWMKGAVCPSFQGVVTTVPVSVCSFPADTNVIRYIQLTEMKLSRCSQREKEAL